LHSIIQNHHPLATTFLIACYTTHFKLIYNENISTWGSAIKHTQGIF